MELMFQALQQNKLFSWPEELFNLFFPICLLPLVALTAIFGHGWVGGYYFYFVFLSNILLLNIGHTVLSFYVLRFPEGQEFLRQISWKEWTGLLTCGLGGLGIFLATGSLENLAGLRASGVGPGTLAIFLLKLFATWHLIFQVRGIMLVYGQGANTGRPDLDRKMFFGIFCCVLFGAALPFFHLTNREFLLESAEEKVRAIFVGAAIGMAGVIVWNNSRGETKNWNKILFLLRLFILPFYIITPLAVFAGQATHGLESIFFFRRLQKKTEAKVSGWAWVLGVLVVSLMGIPVVFGDSSRLDFAPLAGYWEPARVNLFLNVVVAISLTTSLLHFYIESRMYRMRNPAVRNTLGKLLT